MAWKPHSKVDIFIHTEASLGESLGLGQQVDFKGSEWPPNLEQKTRAIVIQMFNANAPTALDLTFDVVTASRQNVVSDSCRVTTLGIIRSDRA